MNRLLGITVVLSLAMLCAPALAQADNTLVGVVQDQGLTVVAGDDDNTKGDLDVRLARNGSNQVVAIQAAGTLDATTGCVQIDVHTVGCEGTFDGVVLYGNGGDDEVELELTEDGVAPLDALVLGGDGNDKLLTQINNLDVPQPDVVLHGEGGNDRLVTGNGADEVLGGDGDDDIETWKGADTARGEGGNDKISVGGGDAADTADGGPGFDEINFSLGDFHRFGFEVTITFDGQANDGVGGEGDNIVVEKITVRADRVTITGSGGDDDIFVEADESTVRGLGGNDKLVTYDGNDTIEGGDGDDFIEAGFGNDILDGGAGVDQFSGDRTESGVFAVGNDEIRARDGNAEQIGCGIGGGDRAIVDHNDVVSSDCEAVDRSAAPAGTGGSGTPGGGTPGGATTGANTLSVPRTISIRNVLAKGLVIQVGCSAGCRIRAQLRVNRRNARRLRLGRSPVLANGRANLPAAGRTRVTIRVVSRARNRLRRMRTITVTLRVTRTIGGRTVTTTRVLKLKR